MESTSKLTLDDALFEQVSTQLHTVKDYIRWSASQFGAQNLGFNHGMTTALDEAVYLVLKALHLPIDTPDTYWDGALTRDEKQAVFEFIKLRINQRIPAAYITREGWFAGLPFYIDERVLVPRSPIAELVETQFAPWVDPDTVENILDMATGSGCIGIGCAYAFPQAHVDVTDISTDALEVARINVERHDVGYRVDVIESDIFSHLSGKHYDLIVTNPPYVDKEDMDALDAEFKHEPELALASGSDGLDFTKALLSQAAEHLTDQGVLIVEVGNSQFELQHQYPQIPFHWFEFQRGGDGVFLITKQQLQHFF